MNVNRKLIILVSICLILIGLILIIIFGVKIEIIKSNIIIADGSSQIVLTSKKVHKYLQNQSETKTYQIKDINKTIDIKCFLVYYQLVNNNYSYYCNLSDGSLLPEGIYNTNINFGQIKIYEYFMYFY